MRIKNLFVIIIKDNKYTFFIPSYQKGYRWTEQEVKALLEDIMS